MFYKCASKTESALNYAMFYSTDTIPPPSCRRWDNFGLGLGRNTYRCCFLLLRESAEISKFQLSSDLSAQIVSQSYEMIHL